MRHFLILLIIVTQGFLGCTDVRLSMKEESVFTAFSLNGQYCSRLGRSITTPLKTLFVVDMSMSNIGRYDGMGNFDSAFGSDPMAQRLDAITDYVEDCGASNAANEFAIAAFSDGVIAPNGNYFEGSCTIEFTQSSAEIANIVNSLTQIQTESIQYYAQNPSRPNSMFQTSYQSGIECAKRIVETDIFSDALSRAHYQVFFVTDGAPSLDIDSNCEDNTDCYRDQVERMVANIEGAQRIVRFQPVFYGDAENYEEALEFLDPIADVGRVDNTLRVDDVLEIGFCDLASNPIQVSYKTEALTVINLTSRLSNGLLQSDSDMDGISDRNEEILGYDPTERRTFGVLDSICQLRGGAQSCPLLTQELSCSGQSNNVGLTDCDLAALSIASSADEDGGIDTDDDGMFDLAEILRASLPHVADGENDRDSDGVSNRIELAQGSQVDVPDRNISRSLLLQYNQRRAPNTTNCDATQEVWDFNIQNLPLVPTRAFADTASRPDTQVAPRRFLDLSHDTNENVILVTFKSIPENSQSEKAELWGAKILVKYGSTPNIQLNPSDFFLLGEVNQ